MSLGNERENMFMEQNLRVQIMKELGCMVEVLELDPRGNREPWEVFELWRSNVRCVSEKNLVWPG